MNKLYIVALMFASIVPSIHALHMFQQNRYECGRFTKWLKGNAKDGLKRLKSIWVLLLVALIAQFVVSETMSMYLCIAIAIFIGCLMAIREKKAKYIKPLVYTGRVKRQIVVLVLLELLGFYLITTSHLASVVSLFVVMIVPWIYIYPMALLTSPIESFVKRMYLNDAKKILKTHSNLITIGITGSYGKTTTKNVMHAVLSEEYQTLMTPASYNTPMGITRTIREYMKPIDEVFVCEMGADHVKDITYLMNFVQPSIGVVTSIGPQHLSTFGSLENIIKEKMEVIEKLPVDGFGVMNFDNQYIREYTLKNSVETVSYGIQYEDVDYRAINIKYSRLGSSFDVKYKDEVIPFETKLLGELNILNILSSIAVARHLNVSWKVIQRAVRNMKQVEHRLERKVINGHTFIDDAFNANPVGSKMALDVLSMMEGTRFVVTPGMIELGEIQDRVNHDFGAYMKGRADAVILVGKKQTAPIYQGLKDSGFDLGKVAVVDTVKEAFGLLYNTASATDTILLENDLPDAFNN